MFCLFVKNGVSIFLRIQKIFSLKSAGNNFSDRKCDEGDWDAGRGGDRESMRITFLPFVILVKEESHPVTQWLLLTVECLI
tara:strand:- start:1102 stop:1344 length:243 start_codon:yes stop_codon:yes gene_type:complete